MSNRENEVCLFVILGAHGIGSLNTNRHYHSQYIIQAESNSTTKEGLRITNRVRRIKDYELTHSNSGEAPVVYTTATKYRLPRVAGSNETSCIETEHDCDKSVFDATLPFQESIHHKFRHTIRHGMELKIEVDHYILPLDKPTTILSGQGGNFAKIDIEDGCEEDIDAYLQTLAEQGISISRIINKPGIEDPNIGEEITQLMSTDYNHAC